MRPPTAGREPTHAWGRIGEPPRAPDAPRRRLGLTARAGAHPRSAVARLAARSRRSRLARRVTSRDCRSCRRRANEYLENRDRLRTLRDNAPPPPRDLWARTAAAIELESQRRRRAPMRGLPLGALSGIVVIVVVLGATLLSNTPTTTVTPPTEFGSGNRGVRRGVAPAGARRDAVPRGRGRRRIRPARPDGSFGYGHLRRRFGLPEEAGRRLPDGSRRVRHRARARMRSPKRSSARPTTSRRSS